MNRVLIIYGAAPCNADDYTEAIKIVGDADVAGVGLDTALVRIPFEWIVTLHPKEAEEIRLRRNNGGLGAITIVSHELSDGDGNDYDVDALTPYVPPSGSSALLGVLHGIRLGYRKIILCGCPLMGKSEKGYEYSNFRKGFEGHYDEIAGWVKSMSGWTRDFLGAPLEAWIDAE